VVVVGEVTFDISHYVVEQTASQPYRLLPSREEGSLDPYRVKDVILRLEGVTPRSKHFVQVPSFLLSLLTLSTGLLLHRSVQTTT
jgi:hypothetical protein